jgi:hypothetical protein
MAAHIDATPPIREKAAIIKVRDLARRPSFVGDFDVTLGVPDSTRFSTP